MLRNTKLEQLKAHLTAPQIIFFKCNTNSETATIASMKVTETLIKHNKLPRLESMERGPY